MEGSGAGNDLGCSKVIELNGSGKKVEKSIPACCRKGMAALPEAEAKLHATVVSGWFSGHRCSSDKNSRPLYYNNPMWPVMEKFKGIPNKERFDEASRRIHACIARAGDSPLEHKANENEIFRCCVHEWSEDEDDCLWSMYGELIRIKLYRNRDFLNAAGWKSLGIRFQEENGHLVSPHFLQMRYHEIKRHRDAGHSSPDMDCSHLDIEHVILYRSWCSRYDKFIMDFYKTRMTELLPNGNSRQFFNVQDWQDIQYEFEFHLKCCPTQTQLQSRLHMLLRK